MVRRKRKNPVGRLGARYGKRVREPASGNAGNVVVPSVEPHTRPQAT
jgi:hypothetical protein